MSFTFDLEGESDALVDGWIRSIDLRYNSLEWFDANRDFLSGRGGCGVWDGRGSCRVQFHPGEFFSRLD